MKKRKTKEKESNIKKKKKERQKAKKNKSKKKNLVDFFSHWRLSFDPLYKTVGDNYNTNFSINFDIDINNVDIRVNFGDDFIDDIKVVVDNYNNVYDIYFDIRNYISIDVDDI